jgi:molecular chaperone DnaK
MPKEVVVGIDFGTSYSSAAAMVDGQVQLAMDGGDPQIPTVVHVPARGDLVVGRDAVRHILGDPTSTVVSVKRLLGRRADDPAMRALGAGVRFPIRSGPGGGVVVRVRDVDWAPSQLVAGVLSRLRSLAERRFGGTVRKAVLTLPVIVPPDYQAQLGRAAGMAGLEVVRWVPEPIAGMLAHGLHAEAAQRNVVVCDFGGGTFDATLVSQSGKTFTPVASGGDPFLGGDDFDTALAEEVAGFFYRANKIDLHRDFCKWTELLWRSESVKRQLSTAPEAHLRMKEAGSAGGRSLDVDLMVERARVVPRWAPLVDRSVGVLQTLLAKTGWQPADVNQVLLVGGTTLIPMVRDAYAALFPGARLIATEWANLAVVAGAATVAGTIVV